MINSIIESPLHKIISPQSIAFYGASNNVSAMGTNLLASVKAFGFEGAIYPVHPKEREVQGLKAYRKVAHLPEIPDLAVLVIPTNIVPLILEECAQKGIKHFIVVSAGFKEIGGDGVAKEEALAHVAKKYDLNLLGPNCIGVTNPKIKLNTTFMPFEGNEGFIGMASQSGSFVTQMFGHLSALGLGFSNAISVGNEVNIDIVDCLEYLGACPRTKVISLYIEGIKRGKAFVETARAIIPNKPIVAFYVGGSEAGRRAGLSHTGAMAGPDKLYDGMFRQCGVIRAQSITELFDFCWILGTQPRAKGRKVVVQTHSGGPGAAAADSCNRAGLKLPSLSKETLSKLALLVPNTGSIHNPVDLTFSKNPMAFFSDIPKILLDEKNNEMLLVYINMPFGTITRSLKLMGVPKDQIEEKATKVVNRQCESLARLTTIYDKPIIGYTYHNPKEKVIQKLLNLGIPVIHDPDRAAKALDALARYSKEREKKPSLKS